MNKISDILLHPTPTILAMKMSVRLLATLMHSKMGVVEHLDDLLSSIGQLGNHNLYPIPKTTICMHGLAFVPRT